MMSRTMKISTVFITVFWCIVVCLFVFTPLYVISHWGRNQAILPVRIETRLYEGLTPDEAAFRIGIHRSHLVFNVTNDGLSYYDVSNAGIGSCFNPQHEITLVFNQDGKLMKAFVEYHYQIDEEIYPITLKATPEVAINQK